MADVLGNLSWLLNQPQVVDPLRDALERQTVPLLPPDTRGVTHIPDGCRATRELPRGRTGQTFSRPDATYLRATFAELLTEPSTLCATCLGLFLSLMDSGHPDATTHWSVVKDAVELARSWRQLEEALAAPLAGYEDLPWSATRKKLLIGHTAAMWAATSEVNRQLDLLVGQLMSRVECERPAWLHVRYAAEDPRVVGRLGRELAQPLATGFTVSLTLPLDPVRKAALDGLVEEVTGELHDVVPLLVRVTRSGVALRERHLAPPLEVVGEVRILTVPRRYAPAAGVEERFRVGWVDLPSGWQHDPAVRDRLRLAAGLWTGGELAPVWETAGQLLHAR